MFDIGASALSLLGYTAEPHSPSDEALRLPDSWTMTDQGAPTRLPALAPRPTPPNSAGSRSLAGVSQIAVLT
jgi:hypothetical protein